MHRHHADVVIAGIISRKCDPLAIGREKGIGFGIGMDRQPPWILPIPIGGVSVACVGKGEVITTQRGGS